MNLIHKSQKRVQDFFLYQRLIQLIKKGLPPLFSFRLFLQVINLLNINIFHQEVKTYYLKSDHAGAHLEGTYDLTV